MENIFMSQPGENFKKFPVIFPVILALCDDPKIAGRDDAEVVSDSVAEELPIFRYCRSEELQDGSPEFPEGRVVPVVGDVAMHHAPTSLNRIEVGAIGWDEVEDAFASWSFQPVPHDDCVVVACIVQEDMNPPLCGMRNFDGPKQRNQARPSGLGDFQHLCLAGFQIEGAMNVQALPASRLLDRKRRAFRPPTSGGTHLVGWMHGIDEHHRFIRAKPVKKLFVAIDECLLARFVEIARYSARLAVFNPQPMEQRDQTGVAIAKAIVLLQPSTDKVRAARQTLCDPSLQSGLLLLAQSAGTAFMAKIAQPLHTLLLICAKQAP